MKTTAVIRLVTFRTHALATVNYSFDSLLIGFLLGPTSVGLYGAA